VERHVDPERRRPGEPKVVWHIPNESNRNSRGVSVVYDYKFDGSGRDYLIRNSEIITEGETGKDLKYQIFDITSRDSDPSKITLVSEITGTPPNSCGPGCGGSFTHRAHKGWWSQDTGYFYAASGEPGFRNVVIQIFDLKDPKAPTFVGRAWLPSQKDGEPGYEGQYAHHPVVDEQRKRLYVGYRNSGWTAEFDIADPAHPKLVWSLDMNPPHRGPHNGVANRLRHGSRTSGRRRCPAATRSSSTRPVVPRTWRHVRAACAPARTCSTSRMRRSRFQCPSGKCQSGTSAHKGGRFGPHQSAETVNGRINRFENKIAWLAYFNAGIRVLDLSDPYSLKELGYYIPKTNEALAPESPWGSRRRSRSTTWTSTRAGSLTRRIELERGCSSSNTAGRTNSFDPSRSADVLSKGTLFEGHINGLICYTSVIGGVIFSRLARLSRQRQHGGKRNAGSTDY
jgi:hypothetical protein